MISISQGLTQINKLLHPLTRQSCLGVLQRDIILPVLCTGTWNRPSKATS
jgi:hypothetical protein